MSARYTGGLVYNAPGGWSGYFDGSGDYLTAPDNAALTFATGDWTAECWCFPTVAGSSSCLFARRATGATYGALNVSQESGGLNLLCGNGSSFLVNVTGTSMTLNAWNHVAAVRNGSTFTLYLNGLSIATATSSGSLDSSTSVFSIGAFGNGSDTFDGGYISNFRFVKGTAVYTSAFTPPNGPLQAITNTSLLTCRYPTFVDGSTNAFTITVNGNTAVNTANPFPTSQLPNPALGGAGNGVYTMSQYAALKAANLWPAYDPYYKNVTMMLHGDGTNAAQNNTFLDSSTNNATFTNTGVPTQGTFTPYGATWSNYFNGSTSYLSLASNSAFNIGSNDASIEMWCYSLSTAVDVSLNGQNSGPSSTIRLLQYGGYYAYTVNNDTVRTTSYPIILNAWVHLAVTITGGTARMFVNGVLRNVTTGLGSVNNRAEAYTIGCEESGVANFYTGYMVDFRFVNGSIPTAYQTSSTTTGTTIFTPPTAPLTAVTNTVILTCQSNYFKDNSSNNFTVTAVGSPSVQRFSPYSYQSYYSTSVIGGSGYFDQTTSFSTPNQSGFNFGTGDFTVEAWVYTTGTGNTYGNQVVGKSNGSSGWALLVNRTTNGYGVVSSTADGSGLSVYTSSLLPPYQWAHIAWVRSSGTNKLYLNGALVSTLADTTNDTNTNALWVASQSNNGTAQNFPGYICDVRIVKGTAVYTSAFTPPTAPLTAVANTSVLCNFTNAAIIDNAMMNDLVTVGNAQISTSVKKYGTGSMYFDGSGDYLVVPPNTQSVLLGTGSFTVEFWLYPSSSQTSTRTPIISFGNGFTTNVWAIQLNNTSPSYVNRIQLWAYNLNSGAVVAASTGTITASTWTHVAVVRNGSAFTIYINGVADGTGSSSASMDGGSTTLQFQVGKNSTDYFNGYIDDLRVTKGVARYTTSFTPPTSQLQDQ